VQEVLMRESLTLGAGQDGIELVGRQGHAQSGEVGQDAFT
jgi:hypothetical protein